MDDPRTPLRIPTEVLTRGFDPTLSVGSARPAVFRSSTYVFPSPEAAERAFDLTSGRAQRQPGENVPLIYSRFNHPNAEILETQIMPLEPGAAAAIVFNCGMAAIVTSMFPHLKPGRAVVYTVPIYGGTQKFIQGVLGPWGVRGVAVRAGDSKGLERAIRETPDLGIVLIETPANPTMTMTDIRLAADCAARRPERPLVMVDNTLLGPVFQHPFNHGADLVIYSATKYLSGYSDLIGGIALAREPAVAAPIRGLRGLFGTILQPDECWILNGRLPMVSLRMQQVTKNAEMIVDALARHPKIARILFPSQFDDPEQIRIRDAQCQGPGALFSIELKGGKRAAFDFLRHLHLARNAVSLGSVETLVCHPRSTTHSGFTDEEFAEAGVTEGLVRFAIGVEDWRDLLADFEQALAKV
jgi:cystathionine beta-lyase/cystathionine gamma-synthase